MNFTVSARAALLALAVLSAAIANEGTKPRRAATDYPVHAESDGVAVGVEYNVRTVADNARSIVVPQHLVIEVAIYPPQSGGVAVAAGHFALRINGSRTLVFADSPGSVAASLKYPDWGNDRGLVAVAGPVIIGAPPTVPRFPGDQRGPHAPPPNGTLTDVDESPWVAEVAIREGRATGPVSGYVYFPYKGKVQRLRSVELIYRPRPDSDAVVMRLR